MSANSVFQTDTTTGWRRGLNNLMSAELRSWWQTSAWWVQALIWSLILGGLTAGIAFSGENVPYTEVVMLYSVFAGLFSGISVVIVMQDSLVGEKQNGTAEWILSKPVSRTAFIASKLVPNWIAFVINVLIIPTTLVFVLLRVVFGPQANPLTFLAAVGVLSAVLLFYQTLTLMLGAFFRQRGPVIGIPLALMFLQQYLVQWFPFLGYVLPWKLIVPGAGAGEAVVPALLLGQRPDSWIPLFGILILSAVFVVVAIWRFSREEF